MESFDRAGLVPNAREGHDDDESAQVRLMSSKKKAAERKKQKRLEKQRSYDKKWRAKKKRKTKENRTQVKDENAQHSLPEAVVSSNFSLPESNILENVMADNDHEMLRCDVNGEDDSAELKSMILDGDGGNGNGADEHGKNDDDDEGSDYQRQHRDVNGDDTDTGEGVGVGADPENEHGDASEEFCIRWLDHDEDRMCDNCHRKCFTEDVSSPYYFDMCLVPSHMIKAIPSPLRKVKKHHSRETALNGARSRGENVSYHLCRECCGFLSTSEAESAASKEEKYRLDKSRHQWSKLWPSFYWDLLVGTDTSSGSPFHTVYEPSHLWRFIPQSIRRYWLHDDVFGEGGCYSGCDESSPPSFFRDRTLDLEEFTSNINEYTIRGFLNALDPSRLADPNDDVDYFLLPDVLCPFGCGEYCHQAVPVDPSLLIQRHLMKVQLNLSRFNSHENLFYTENSRLDYIRLDDEPIDTVLMNDDWKVQPSVVIDRKNGLRVLYCRNHGTKSSQRRLYTFPPKKVDNTLCSTRPDCLAHCCNKPRCVSSVRAQKYNTFMTSSIFSCGFAGCDSADVVRDSRFGWQLPSLMLFNSEVWSMAGRGDIRDLAAAKVQEGTVMPELHEQWSSEQEKLRRTRMKDISMALRGSTYVPTFNALMLQKHSTEDSRITVEVRSRERTGGEHTTVQAQLLRSWTPTIGNIQVEDPEGYGAIMKGIKPYMGRGGSATMMLWVVVGMVSSCNELHYAIDQRVGGHHYNNYTGYLLAHINSQYMKHRDSVCPRKSPFSGSKSASFILKKLENCLPQRMRSNVCSDVESYFRFGLDYMENLFPRVEFPNVGVCSDISDVQSNGNGIRRFSTAQDIYISVGKRRPVGVAHFYLGDEKYEARVVIAVGIEDAEVDDLTPNHFTGTRFTRHGGGNCGWWVQKRSRTKGVKQMMKQHVRGLGGDEGADPFPRLPGDSFYYICVYVKECQPSAEKYKIDMLKTVGAQCAVLCSCMEVNPLIISGRRKEDKRACMTPGCNKVEKYCCNTYKCKTRICEECYADLAGERGSVVIDPPSEDGDDSGVGSGSGHSISESEDSEGDGGNSADEVEDQSGEEILDDDIEGSLFESDDYSNCSEAIDVAGEDDFGDDESCSSSDSSRSSCSGDEGRNDDLQSLGRNESLDDLVGMDVETDQKGDDFDEYVTCANTNYIDESVLEDDGNEDHTVPRTNAGQSSIEVCERNVDDDDPERWYSAPMHVLFNQLGSLCTRYNKRIKGTQFQQHFVQSIVSSMRGLSFPLLYVTGMLFPKHFWASSTKDPSAILGVMPISCYRKKNNPDGFASKLQIARTHATTSSSSTSCDHHYVAHLFDMLANRAQSGRDSRDFLRKGFKVSKTSENGIALGEADESRLHQSLDSMQAARNLASASQYVGFDVFFTFTMGASEHPGVKHLYDWKQSKGWTKHVPNWCNLTEDQKFEVNQSFEMAYTSVLNRNWLETRKLLIEFVVQSARTVLGKDCIEAFFRDEYQEDSANVCHLHGLMSLDKEDMSNEDFQEFVCSLQRNAVCDLVLSDEVGEYIEEGLLRDSDDWVKVTLKADEVLSHKVCTKRCQRRVNSTGDDKKDFRCRKRHPVFDSIDPIKDEFLKLPFKFSQECLDILSDCEFYEQPTDQYPNGRFLLDLLEPRRHIGKVTPSARENMSEVFPKYFTLLRSMQNGQVVTGTNGVSRYVVKYIVKLDTGNRCIVWADQHTGAVVRMEKQFLHNTKITSSAKHEDQRFKKSRASKHQVGRYACFAELQHKVLGYEEVQQTMQFCEINTMPAELRPTTKVSLDRNGNLRRPDLQTQEHEDGRSSFGVVHDSRLTKFGPHSWRNMSRNQVLTLNNGGRSLTMSYDAVSIFSLRPVELMRLFPFVPKYFRWFHIDKRVLSAEEVLNSLNNDITKSVWIDGIGRRVRLRSNAFNEVKDRLEEMDTSELNDDEMNLRQHILDLIEADESSSGRFVYKNTDHRLPIPVTSSVTPRNPSDFLLHVMLMIGEVSTELDLKCHASMKDALAATKVIPSGQLDDVDHLTRCSIHAVKRVIREVIPFQAITMTVIQEFIVKSKRLFHSVLLEDAIPLSELPPCLLTEILNDKDEKLRSNWEKTRCAQLSMIYDQLSNQSNSDEYPAKDDVKKATKENPIHWDPISVMRRSSSQSDESFQEQKVAAGYGKRAVDKYCRQFGVTSRTRGVLTHGSPGAGKTYVSFLTVLYSLSRGLRVMTSALMAFRSQCIGGIHLHKLFCLEVSKSNNIFRLAELAVEKLHRKSNLFFLHYLLTMDVLFIDEVGQLSSQQFMQLDIILRHVRENNLPFGGVLILGTFDHAQQGAIQGTPFLLSSLLTTEFTLIKLRHSVRAHNDPVLQEIQDISRMNPDELIGNQEMKDRFTSLVSESFQFVDSMSDSAIGPNHQRLYAKRKSAAAAGALYVTSSAAHLASERVPHKIVRAEDYQRTAHTNATFQPATDQSLVSALNKHMNEPSSLLFYQGAFFESTTNGVGYSYSQVLYMRDMPSEEDLRAWADIVLWAKPPSGTIDFIDMDVVPTEEELLARQWKKVRVKVAMERLIQCNHLEGARRMYTLRHLGASTINRSMGLTIKGPVAIEFTQDCMPWEKEQIVVMISRTTLGSHIYIVGNKEWAIRMIWDIICRKNQFTDLQAAILANLSINADGEEDEDVDANFIPMQEIFPYRMCDVQLPTSDVGFVYLLVSISHPSFTYVGQTKQLGQRLNQHNAGNGSQTTAPTMYLPYHLAAYMITPHLDKSQRMSIEQRWQRRIMHARRQGNDDIGNQIDLGRDIMLEINSRMPADEHIRMVSLIRR